LLLLILPKVIVFILDQRQTVMRNKLAIPVLVVQPTLVAV
jgi:hypothetical protein